MENNTNSPKNTWASNYFKILSGFTIQINWFVFLLLLISVTTFFSGYKWYFSSMKYAIDREEINFKEIDSLEINIKKHHLANDPNFDFNDFLQKKSAKLSKSIKSDSIPFNLKDIVRSNIANYRELNSSTNISTVPIAGLKTPTTDYLFLLYLVGTLIFLWLFKVLNDSRNVLVETFNFPTTQNYQEATTIPALFYIILPGTEKRKFYFYFEASLLIFIISILRLAFSNYYDLSSTHSLYDIPLEMHPGFNGWQYFWAFWVYILFAALAIIVFIKAVNILIDIRNLLILLKWQRNSFYPQLYQLFEEAGIYLIRFRNRMEYRNVGISNKMQLCIYANVYNPTKRDVRFISGRINLVRSLRIHEKNKGKNLIDREFKFSQQLNRDITFEEENMRLFFNNILKDPSYEKQLASSFKTEISKPVLYSKSEESNSSIIDPSIVKEVVALFEQSKLQKAIELLSSNLNEDFLERKIELRMLLSKLNKIENDNNKGIIPNDYYYYEYNKLINYFSKILSLFSKEE